MSDIPLFRRYTILDACCLINLYASGVMESILNSIPGQVAVVQYVRDKEVRYIYTDGGGTTSIDLQAFLDKNLLFVVDLENEREQELVIDLAFLSNGKMGNGEAYSASIALYRNWSFGTDDKDTILLLQHHQPQLSIVTTPDLLKHWVDTIQPPSEVIHDVLENIRRRARYKPHGEHHFYKWWQMH